MGVRIFLVVVAIVLRLAIAVGSHNVTQDMRDWLSMRRAFVEHGFTAYTHFPRYPYPPGLIPWTVGSIWVGDRFAIPRDVALKLPYILADACLVFLICVALERRRASRRVTIIAASLVAFGPTFVVNSGYHGQFDALAILPAVVAVLLWDPSKSPARALICGGLIGIGAATKTVPAFAALALFPTMRSWREGALLAGAVAAVVGAAILPFLLADPSAARSMVGYAGYPGLGGWSVIVQPDLARTWLVGEAVSPTGATRFLYAHGPKLAVAALGAVGVLLLWRRTPPLEAACAVWLTVYAFAGNFFGGYANWGLPFFLMAGRIGDAAFLTALLLPITVISYILRPDISPITASVYQVLVIALQLTFVSMWIRDIVRVALLRMAERS